MYTAETVGLWAVGGDYGGDPIQFYNVFTVFHFPQQMS